MKHRIFSSVALLLTLSLAAPVMAGTYYEAEMTADSKEVWRVHAWIEGPNARIEYVAGPPPMSPGNYLLTNDGGENILLVNSSDKTYAPFNLEEMLASLGSITEMMEATGGMVQMDFRDGWSDEPTKSSGETMLGCSTTKVSWSSGFTIAMKILGMKRQNTLANHQEAWICSDLKDMGFGVWLRAEPPKTGNPAMDEALVSSWQPMDGFPLKLVTNSTNTGKKGKQTSSTSVMTVTDLRQENVDDAKFVLDPTFTETTLMPAIPAQGDSEEGGLGGLFKRRKRGGRR